MPIRKLALRPHPSRQRWPTGPPAGRAAACHCPASGADDCQAWTGPRLLLTAGPFSEGLPRLPLRVQVNCRQAAVGCTGTQTQRHDLVNPAPGRRGTVCPSHGYLSPRRPGPAAECGAAAAHGHHPLAPLLPSQVPTRSRAARPSRRRLAANLNLVRHAQQPLLLPLPPPLPPPPPPPPQPPRRPAFCRKPPQSDSAHSQPAFPSRRWVASVLLRHGGWSDDPG